MLVYPLLLFICLSHDGWFILRVGSGETSTSLRIQPQAFSLFAHLLTTLHSYTEGLLSSKFMQQLCAVFFSAQSCAVAGYFDLGLAPRAPSTAFQLACAQQKTSSQEMHRPISSCLTLCQRARPVSACLISEQWVGQLGEPCLCSEQGEGWQGCPPCFNKHWHITQSF